MSEKKAARINVNKSLLDVSLTTLAAVGSATGNPLVAGVSAIPQAVVASGMLKPLIEQQPEVYLELPVPHWWTQEPRTQSWQDACSSVEAHFPATLKAVEEQIRKEAEYPSSRRIKQIFVEQVTRNLSPWQVPAQDRAMFAGHVTPLLMEKSALLLKDAIDASRQDAFALWLTAIADKLDRIQRSTSMVISATTPVTITMQTNSSIAAQNPQAIADSLEQKRLQNKYNVYICYAEADEAEVMAIGDKLKAYGILAWFDMLEIRPGSLEEQQQDLQIQEIPAAAVFVGEHAIISQQELQMYSFIGQFLKRKIPVIPVILASTSKDPDFPPYLGNFKPVDFRRSQPEPMRQLIWGITGIRPTN